MVSGPIDFNSFEYYLDVLILLLVEYGVGYAKSINPVDRMWS